MIKKILFIITILISLIIYMPFNRELESISEFNSYQNNEKEYVAFMSITKDSSDFQITYNKNNNNNFILKKGSSISFKFMFNTLPTDFYVKDFKIHINPTTEDIEDWTQDEIDPMRFVLNNDIILDYSPGSTISYWFTFKFMGQVNEKDLDGYFPTEKLDYNGITWYSQGKITRYIPIYLDGLSDTYLGRNIGILFGVLTPLLFMPLGYWGYHKFLAKRNK